MARSKLDKAVDFLKQRGWEFRPAEKIQGVFKPVGKYDAKNPAQDDFGIYDNKTLRNYAGLIAYTESQGKTFNYGTRNMLFNDNKLDNKSIKKTIYKNFRL